MKSRVLFLILFFLGSSQVPEESTTVYMIGDSTMADKAAEDEPERGWGQMLPYFFDGGVRIVNRAMNGRSTGSFLREGRWEPILDALRPGDYVIIQFGHNDEKPEKAERYTPPEDYRKNLVRFVTETLARKAQPVLCTPVVRRRFDAQGKFYDEHGVYPGLVREVAAAYHVPVLDMHRESWELVERLGPEESKKVFLWVPPGAYASLPEGRQDNTHFGPQGAWTMAQIAVREIRRLDLGLARYLETPGAEVRFTVTNPAPFDRTLETVELPWAQLRERLGLTGGEDVEVTGGGLRLVSQKVDADGDGVPEVVVFQTGFRAGEAIDFSARATRVPMPVASPTVAQYMFPRKDVAWENDRIAFRIYGGPLAGDVRSGIDVLVKRVRYYVLEKWYHFDSLKGDRRISYHVDHGEGADYFLVGKTLGAGGCALWTGSGLRQTKFFTDYRIVAAGPVRAAFTVKYQSDSGSAFTEEKTYTLDAGMNLTKIDVRYGGLAAGEQLVALGLVKRKNTLRSADQGEGWMNLLGPVDDTTSHGWLGTGVVAPAASIREVREDSLHHLMIATLSGGSLTYYAGGGWSLSGNFETAAAWERYLSVAARGLRYPLTVRF